MKILMISSSILNPYLGPSTATYNLMKGFIKISHLLEKKSIELIFLSLHDVGVKNIEGCMKIVGAGYLPLTSITGELHSYIKSREIGRNVDLVHSHYVIHLIPWIFTRKPTILTLHGIYWKEKYFVPINPVRRELNVLLLDLRFKVLLRRLTRLIAISRYVVDELKQRRLNITDKIAIIGNPVSDMFFKTRRNEEPIVVYPAKLHPLKNQLKFIKALSLVKKEIREYVILFIGDGDYHYRKVLEDLARRNDLSNVKFTGRVSYNKMPLFYSRASLMALTSFQENLPMSVLEAMASGVPPLVSGVGELSYLIESFVNGVKVNPYDEKDIADKLLALINDKNLRRKISENAKRTAEEYRSDKIALRHLALYEELYNEI